MVLDVLVCALWCVGILTLVWAAAGWFFLPLSGSQITLLFPEKSAGQLERQLRTNAWLRAAGFEQGRVFVISDGLDDAALTEASLFAAERAYLSVLTRAELATLLEMGCRDDKTGRTDDSRDGSERSVPKPGERI